MKSNTLAAKVISPNGEMEQAEDSGVVLPDVLSEYWTTFYETKTTGRDLKVPVLSHSVDGMRWRASSKILYVAYYLEDYFLMKLAASFLEYVVGGDNQQHPKQVSCHRTPEVAPVCAHCQRLGHLAKDCRMAGNNQARRP